MKAVFEPAINAPGLGEVDKIETVTEVERARDGFVFITYRHGEENNEEERIEILGTEMKVVE